MNVKKNRHVRTIKSHTLINLLSGKITQAIMSTASDPLLGVGGLFIFDTTGSIAVPTASVLVVEGDGGATTLSSVSAIAPGFGVF